MRNWTPRIATIVLLQDCAQYQEAFYQAARIDRATKRAIFRHITVNRRLRKCLVMVFTKGS